MKPVLDGYSRVTRFFSLLTLVCFLPSALDTWRLMPFAGYAWADADHNDPGQTAPLLTSQEIASLRVPEALVRETEVTSAETNAGISQEATASGAEVVLAAHVASTSAVYADTPSADDTSNSLVPEEPTKPSRLQVALRAPDLDALAKAVRSRQESTRERREQLARPFVIQRKGSESPKQVEEQGKEEETDERGRRGTSVIRRAPKAAPSVAPQAGESAVVGATDASVAALVEADQLLEAGEIAEAALGYLQIQESYPGTEAAYFAEESMLSLARQAEKGQISAGVVKDFLEQLPAYEALQTPEGKYWLALSHNVAGAVARANGELALGNAHYRKALGTFESVMLDYPAHPFQVSVVRSYMKAASKLGVDEYSNAAAKLLQIINAAHEPNMAVVAARSEMAIYYHRIENNIGDAMIQMNSIAAAFGGGAFENELADESTLLDYRGHLQFVHGYALFQLKDFEGAIRVFLEMTTRYAQGREPLELAHLYLALSEYYVSGFDAATGIAGFEGFLNKFPDGQQAPAACYWLAMVYAEAHDFESAKKVFQHIPKTYADSEFSEIGVRAAAEMDGRLREEAAGQATGAQPQEAQAAVAVPVAMNCGPSALQKMMASYGLEASLEELSAAAGMNPSLGTSMSGLVAAASEWGLELKGVNATTIEGLAWPFIAHLDGNHYVLVRGQDGDSVAFDDVDGGTQEQPLAEFQRRWSGDALVLADDRMASAKALDSEKLDATVGGIGIDIFPVDLSDNNLACTNQDPSCCPKDPCCKQGWGPGAGDSPSSPPGRGKGDNGIRCMQAPCSGGPFGGPERPGNPDGECPKDDTKPDSTSPPRKPAYPGIPGSLNPSESISLSSNTLGINGWIDPLQGALVFQETDLAFGLRGSFSIMFSRQYHGAWGGARGYYANDLPWSNNIGRSWTHNYNQHLRVASYSSQVYVTYFDAAGKGLNFTRSEANNPDGYDYFTINQLGETDALNEPRFNTLRRNVSSGAYELVAPGGAALHFSAPKDDTAPDPDVIYGFCRLERIVDRLAANEIVLSYNSNNWNGQLTKIAPSGGDTRYIELQYAVNNRISKARLMDSAAELKYINYDYTDKNLTKVTFNGNTDNPIRYNYATTVVAGVSKIAISKVTDRLGNETDFEFEYHDNDMRIASKIRVIYENGLVTGLTKDSVTTDLNLTSIRNYNGATALTRWSTDADGVQHMVNPSYMRFYHTPTGGTYDSWDYTYNSSGALLTINAPDGVAWVKKTYTANGRLSKVTEPTGEVSTLNYANPSSDFYPESATLVDGTKLYYYYDSYKRLTRVAHPSTSTSDPPSSSDGSKIEFDAYGQITKSIGPDSSATYTQYDSRGFVTKVILPDDNPSSPTHALTYAYDAYGALTSMTDTLGRTTTYEYLHEGCGGCGGGGGGAQLTKVTAPGGLISQMEYDQNGRVTKSTAPSGLYTTVEYDNMGYVTKTTAPGGRVSTVEYNLLGQATKRTDVSGHSSTFAYDFMGRVTSSTDAEGITVSYAYDRRGNMTTLTDGLSNTTTYYYDTSNRLTREKDAINKERRHYYDNKGRMTKTAAGASGTTDPIEYFFNNATGSMTKVTYTNGGVGRDATYYYDIAGRMTRVDDWMGGSGSGVGYDGHYLEYDTLGRVTRYRDFDDDPGGTRKKLDYVYDHGGRVLTMTDYEGYQTFYTYNTVGQLSTITAPGSKVWDYDYNSFALRTKVTLPNGMTTNYAHDATYRLTQIAHKDSSTIKEGWNYSLAEDGNILRMASAVSGSGQAWDYGYDKRHRLVDAIRINESGIPQSRESYVYDAGDNMLTKDFVAYEAVVSDNFSDNDYTNSPTWTISSGTWSAASGYLSYSSGGILPTAYVAQTEEDFDVWFSYYLSDTSGGKVGTVQLRNDGSNIDTLSFSAASASLSTIGGAVDTNTGAGTTQATWYDCYVKIRGTSITVWRGLQGQGLEQILSTTSASSISANATFRFSGTSAQPRFDNFRIMKAKATDTSLTDDFSDNNYNSNPAWTVGAGTWSAASGYMENTAHATQSPNFRMDTQNGDVVGKFRFNMRSSGTTSGDPRLYFIFRGNNSAPTHRLEVIVAKALNQIRLGQYNNGTNSNLATAYPLTINYDTDYDVQVVADGKHVEVWWGPAGGDMAKIIEVDSAAVLSGPRLSFLATTNTVVRVDNISITTPDTDRTTYTYNNGNELLTMVKDSGTTTFTYDDWGRQVSKVIGANSSVYTYRFGSMLKEINSTIPGEADQVQYAYDAFYKRREVRVTEASVVTSDQWYRYDTGFNAIARYDDGDLTDWVVGTRNQTVTYTGMTPLSEVPGSNPSSGSYRHYVHDHLGSTRALYDGSKVLLARQAYTPYGEQAASTAGVEATYSYTGKPWEEETGLYFFPIRYYSPRVARWAWRDPAGMVDGPNVYGYVQNKPIAKSDLLGLMGPPSVPPPTPLPEKPHCMCVSEWEDAKDACDMAYWTEMSCAAAVTSSMFTCVTAGPLACAFAVAMAVTVCGASDVQVRTCNRLTRKYFECVRRNSDKDTND